MLYVSGLTQPAAAQVVDNTSLTGKLVAGYQGWFACPGDGGNSYVHWSRNGNDIGPGLYTVDIWPDVSEYSTLFTTPNVQLLNGSTGQLFSSRTAGTVNKHFEWMKQYGIDGAFLQRFVVGVTNPPTEGVVLQNERAAANAHGRIFAVEYDTSGTPEASVYQKITDDWKNLVDVANIKNDPRLLHHNGKPVVVIWGLFDDRYSLSVCQQIQNFFKNDPVYGNNYCIGGVPGGWRTVSTTGWPAFYRAWHCIHPWTVGAYMTNADILNWKNNFVAPDISTCNSLGIQYLPVIWPGFSWDNLMQLPPGTSNFPRRGGQHLWDQAFHFEGAGLSQCFIAMFDEVDEGTAVFKISNNHPTTDNWITTGGFPNDWWLRLAGSAGQMVRGEISLSQTIPIDTYTCGDDTMVNLGTTDVNDGCFNVQVADGDTTPANIGGRDCRKNVSASNDSYMYFSIDDAQSYQGNCPVIYIRFDFYNSGGGSIQLQYDSIAGGAYKNGPSVSVGTNNTWKTTTFNVTDAYFGNRQNNGADFRFWLGGNKTRHIDVVRVSNRDPVGIFTATPTSGTVPLLVNFNGTASYDPDGTINLYSWNFGDGGTATGSTTSHTYVYGGNITASFTVRDNQGRTDTETVQLNITGPPSPASNPTPANAATNIATNAQLSWTSGTGATSHNVRFGTTNPPPFVQNQAGITFNPGTLANNTTYYWRIDEQNAQGTTTGTVWSFTTVAPFVNFSNSTFAASADGWNIVLWHSGSFLDGTMAFDGTTGNPAGSMKSGASGGTNNTDSCNREGGEINKIISTVGYAGIAVDYDVRFSTDQTATTCAGSCTVLEGDCADKLAVYYSTAGGSGPWTLLEQVYANSVTQGVFNTRHLDLSSVTAANQNANFALRFRFQFNTDPNDFGYLDNIKVSGLQSGSAPGPATNPNPANSATGVNVNADLSWTAGSGATSHDVRFGTTNPPPFVQNQAGTTYDPGTLNGSTTYFWRIDEKNGFGTTTGTVWSFTTAAPPAAPTVTAPTSGSVVTSLTPTITWTGDAHDQYQVRITQQNDAGTSTNGWDSGTVTSSGNSAVSGTLRDYSFYYVFVRLHNATGGWGAWSASGYNFVVTTNSVNGTVFLGNSMPTANTWQIYDTNSFENGSGITSTIVSDGGSNVWQLFDNSSANRCKEKLTNGMNIDFTVGASCAARMRATGITGTPTFNLGISNGNVGGHYLRLYTNEVRLVDNAGNNRGSYLHDATVYHKYHLTVKNATPGSNSTAAWKVYVDGTQRISFTGAGTHEGWDGFFAGHADTTATGTWWFDNISGRSDGEFTPAQWDPVY